MEVRPLTSPSERFDVRIPEGKKFDLVGLGQNAVDHILVVSGYPKFNAKTELLHYEKGAGGMVASAIVFAVRMGLTGKYIGKVGSDELGRFSAESLQMEQVDTSSVVVEEGAQSHTSFIMVDQRTGERTILWKRDPELNFRIGELSREDICSGRILLLDGDDPDASMLAASWAQEASIPVVADLDRVTPKTKDLLPLVDFPILSANFPSEYTGIADPAGSLLALRKCCRGFLIVTAGAQGAMAVIGNRCIRFPALKIRAVDTTGAGDIFHGGFIFGLLKSWPLERIMAFANAAAGLNCTRLGARQGIAPLAQIMESAQLLVERRP